MPLQHCVQIVRHTDVKDGDGRRRSVPMKIGEVMCLNRDMAERVEAALKCSGAFGHHEERGYSTRYTITDGVKVHRYRGGSVFFGYHELTALLDEFTASDDKKAVA